MDNVKLVFVSSLRAKILWEVSRIVLDSGLIDGVFDVLRLGHCVVL